MSERWQAGDVVIWIQTGAAQDAKTDSDIYLKFYDADDNQIGWVHAFERGDMTGFEEGELNCGYLGNIESSGWLQSLRASGHRLSVRIENVTDDRPRWFVDYIALDFRESASEGDVRLWRVGQWIEPVDDPIPFEAAADSGDAPAFGDIGFDKELEIEAGGPDQAPSDL